jgi:hypothetical protein
MTRTTYHQNPHDNDADDDKDESSGIVSQPVVCGPGFFGISFITLMCVYPLLANDGYG